MFLFKALPENFFSILNSKYKEIYAETISLIYKDFISSRELGIKREILLNKLYELYIQMNISNKIEVEDDDGSISIELKDFSSFIIRKLKEAGWLSEEIDNNYHKRIAFSPNGFLFAQTIDAVKNQIDIEVTGYTTPIDYQSYIYTIYMLLKDYKKIDGDIVIDRIYKEMEDLSKLLLSINSNIKSYLDKSLQYNQLDKLLELHFDKYMKEIIGKSYHQLKTSDNLAKYKGSIIDKVDQMIADEEYLNKTCQSIMEKNDYYNKEAIYTSLKKKLSQILDFFLEDMDNMIRIIDYKNSEYIKSTINRIKYISDKSQNIQGQINTILKHFVSNIQKQVYGENEKDIELVNQLFNVYTVDFIDDKSFYVPHKVKSDFIPSRIRLESNEDSKEKMEQMLERLSRRLNKGKAYETSLNYLQNNDYIMGSQINIKDEEDFLKFLNMIIYSNAPGIEYQIELLEELIVKDNSKFKEFILRRK